MKTSLVLALMTSQVVLPSCSTIGARSKTPSAAPYSGVKQNVYYLTNPSKTDQPVLQPLNIIDLPLSAVADTLLLPIDLWNNRHPTKNDSPPSE